VLVIAAGALVAGFVALFLARLPWWVHGFWLGLIVFTALALAVIAQPERAAAAMFATFLAAGLFVPVGSYAQRGSRIAPRRKKPKANKRSKPEPASDGVDIPNYQIVEKVGSGGMASVYRAKRNKDGKVVALKVPMEQYVADAKFIRRFHREAEVAQQLDHINIVRTYEHGSIGLKHYMAMEFVEGRSLENYIEAKELTTDTSVEVMKLVVGALQHIHAAGIIHRDIKPANIMILKGGLRHDQHPPVSHDAVKLMDFGIAGGKVMTRLTMTGARIGTPVYMSPEQARGLNIDHRSDIYSLGLVFYEMLVGQTAFKGGYEAIVHQQIFQTPTPPRQLNLEVPRVLDQLVMRMIAKEPDERPRLEEVFEILDQGDFDAEPDVDLPSRIILTVDAHQGVMRLLDTDGNLHHSFGDIGMSEGNFSTAPLSLALDDDGNYFVAIFEYRAGQEAEKMIYKLNENGNIIMSFGDYGTGKGKFLYPVALIFSQGSLYVLDAETHVVQRFSPDGQYLSHFGGTGKQKGRFQEPKGLYADSKGHIYVLDYGNKRVQQFDADGKFMRTWGPYRMGGDQPVARLLDGFTTSPNGHVYISDGSAKKIRKLTPEGRPAMNFNLDSLQDEVSGSLLDLGLDHEGCLYAARRGGHTIRKYDPSGRLLNTFETYAPIIQMFIDVNTP
jgi:serine/threonine-protein kinase